MNTKKAKAFLAIILFAFVLLVIFDGFGIPEEFKDSGAFKMITVLAITAIGALGKSSHHEKEEEMPDRPVPGVETPERDDFPAQTSCYSGQKDPKKQKEQLESLYQCGMISKEEYHEQLSKLR